jgi:2'-5' RNA ligase
VAFLGEAEPPDLSAVAAKHQPFSVCLEGVARFGTAVGLQVRGDALALADLAAAVRKACRRQGIPQEHRRYRPHLTVARGQVPPELRSYSGPAWTVSELELVRSTLGRPVVHEVLTRWPLGGVAG